MFFYFHQNKVNPCGNNPCLNGAICSAVNSSYVCQNCPPQYTGQNCETCKICFFLVIIF